MLGQITPRTRFADVSSWAYLSRALVFLKYPIIGVVVEAVGFMGLFGYVPQIWTMWSALTY